MMINKIFPRENLHIYNGRQAARWFLILAAVVTIGRSLAHILLPDGGAQSIATIPLDSFTVNGAKSVVLIFALWGLSQLLIGLLYLVILWRYPALIPLAILTMIVEYGSRLVIMTWKSIGTTGSAPGAVGNYIILPIAILMLYFSLRTY